MIIVFFNLILFRFFVQIDFDALIEEINDKHSTPWAELCRKHGVTNTPLSSFLYKEDLQNKHLYLNGTKLTKLGFSYNYPTIISEYLSEVLEKIAVEYALVYRFASKYVFYTGLWARGSFTLWEYYHENIFVKISQ